MTDRPKRITVRAAELYGVGPKLHTAAFTETLKSSRDDDDQDSRETLLLYSALVAITEQLTTMTKTLDLLVKLQREAAEPPAPAPAPPKAAPMLADPRPVGTYGPFEVPFESRCGAGDAG